VNLPRPRNRRRPRPRWGWLAFLPSPTTDRLDGSRFGACPATLATFASNLIPPNTRENKRLSGTSQRNAFALDLRTRLHPGHRAASPGLIRGSRLFSRASAVLTLKRNSRGRLAHAKATPLQALGKKCLSSTCQAFRGRGRLRTIPYEDTSPEAKLIARANMIVLNRNESSA